MEFWTGNQRQSSPYSKFGTVPGRSCAYNYHDRHQSTHYPLYYNVQQEQGRESSYWTAPGSRTGRTPHDYTNWTDQDLSSSTSSQFPFILDCHPQQHQDLGEYQLQEARDKEWTAAQGAAREYERGYLREGWQRRWEPCSPVRYNREVFSKRNDNSYRELEAWAARYSHSLPRQKRIEAELRGSSHGLQESRAPDRDISRGVSDPRVVALQQVIQSANLRETTLWDRGGRHPGPTQYPVQTLMRDTSRVMDMKEKTNYQRRMFSQPPDYIAPPPYNSPHKSSPASNQCDTSLEKEGKRQSYWAQPKLQMQDVSALLSQRRVEKDGNQGKTAELEGLRHRRQETNAFQASSPDLSQLTNIQHEVTLPLQQPQVLQAFQNTMINENLSTKVIEGRKFRLNKKTGGLTIFCLVSRIAGIPDTQSLPLCTSKPDIQNTDLGEPSKDLRDPTGGKLADEVDFTQNRQGLKEQKKTSPSRGLEAMQQERPTCFETEMLCNVATEVSQQKVDADSVISRHLSQSAQPVSVKYPLWREPSLTSRAETESPSTCLKVNSEEGESDIFQNPEDSVKVQPIDIEVRRLDITKASESEDNNDLLVIDTTCVLVKMELIPSPKKEHVHYLDSIPHTEETLLDCISTTSPGDVQTNSQMNPEATSEKNPDTNPIPLHEELGTEADSDLGKKKTLEEETEISSPCTMTCSVSDRETMAERAERILGIPFQECMNDHQPKDVQSLLDLITENEKSFPPPTEVDCNLDTTEHISEDKKEKEESCNSNEVGQTENAVSLPKPNDAKDQEKHEGSQDFPRIEEQMSDEKDPCSQLRADEYLLEDGLSEELLLDSTDGESKTEKIHDGDMPIEKHINPQHPELSLKNVAPNQEVSSLTHNTSEQLPAPPLLKKFPKTSASHKDPSPGPPLEFTDLTAESLSTGAEDQDDLGESSHPLNHETSKALTEDLTEVWVSSEQVDASCVKESDVIDDQQINQFQKDLQKGNFLEDVKDLNSFPDIVECVQADDASGTKERFITEDQLPREDFIREETLEIIKDYAMREYVQAEDVDSSTTEVQPKEVTQDLTDSQTLMETKLVQDSKPHTETPNSSFYFESPSNFEVFSPSEPSSSDASNKPDEELISPLEIRSICSSALNPVLDTDLTGGIPETLPPPLNSESCEEHLQLPSSSDLSPVLDLWSSPPLTQKEFDSGFPDAALKEPLQYPTSLRDAVTRIRRHTAPDSENEDEEPSELWDLESMGEELGFPDVVESIDMEKIFFDAGGKQVYTHRSDNDIRGGQIEQSPDPGRHPEEDTLSCSSASSHGSEDTVIVADDDMPEESRPDACTDIEHKSNLDQFFSCAETEETKAKSKEDNDEGESLKNESRQSEEVPSSEGSNILTKATELTKETKQEESEVFVPSEVTDPKEVTESESVM